MGRSREIGWSQKEILLHDVSKELERWINVLSCCSTTTTTTALPITTTSTTTEEITTTTTTTIAEPFFMMKFDDLNNADLMVGGDATDVADWNTFFDLPTNGTPFDNIAIDGVNMTVTLYGGGNMTLSDHLFGGNDPTGTSLLEVEDNGITIACNDDVFSDYGPALGCYELYKIHLPSCVSLGDNVFADCEKLSDLVLPFDSYTNLGDYVFSWTLLLPEYNFPNLITAGEGCFGRNNVINNLDFPNLTTTGFQCFTNCRNVTTGNFPLLTSIGGQTFNYWLALTSLNIPICNNLGGTIGNNLVFQWITGRTITITIPHALMTCNGGSPDGDLAYLIANNTVNIIYSD